MGVEYGIYEELVGSAEWVSGSNLLELYVTSYMNATRVVGAIGGVILAQRGQSAEDTAQADGRDWQNGPASPRD